MSASKRRQQPVNIIVIPNATMPSAFLARRKGALLSMLRPRLDDASARAHRGRKQGRGEAWYRRGDAAEARGNLPVAACEAPSTQRASARASESIIAQPNSPRHERVLPNKGERTRVLRAREVVTFLRPCVTPLRDRDSVLLCARSELGAPRRPRRPRPRCRGEYARGVGVRSSSSPSSGVIGATCRCVVVSCTRASA